MGVNFQRSSGTVPLGADATCTIFSGGTEAATNQSIDRFHSEKFQLPVYCQKDKIDRTVNSNLDDHWFVAATEEIEHAGSALCHWFTGS